MILVDSSVWIDHFRSSDTPQVALLDSFFGRSPLAVGDLIAAKDLQGVRDEQEFKLVKKTPRTPPLLGRVDFERMLVASAPVARHESPLYNNTYILLR